MVLMPRIKDALPLMTLFGGMLAIMSVFHFMEKLAFYTGAYHESLRLISALQSDSDGVRCCR